MAMTHDYMDYLNEKVGICPAGSQEEFQAANTIADLMRQHDTEPNIEEFDAKTYGGAVTGVLYALMFVGIVLGGIGAPVLIAIGFVLAVGPAALFILKFLGHDFISGLGPTTRSQNVVAFHEATGPMVIKGNRPIVIVAHYDAPHENVLYSSPVAQFIPTLWKASKYCVLGVAVCMFIQVLVFIPESFRRFLWVIGIIAALPLAVLGVTSVLEQFSDCTDGANDNKSGVAALLGVLENVRPSGLESVHGAESIESAVEAMHQAAEQAAAAAAAQANGEQPEIPYAGLDDRLGTIALEAGAAEQPFSADGDDAEEEPEEEDEPQFVYKRGKVEGVRHGADIVKSLGMLPEQCDVEYVEPEPIAVPVPPKPKKKRAAKPAAPVAPAAATAPSAAPAWASAQQPAAADESAMPEPSYEPLPYTEDGAQGDDFAAKALSFLRGVGDKLSAAGHQIGEKVSDVKERAAQASANRAEAAGEQPADDFVADAQYEQIDEEDQPSAPLPDLIPFRPEQADTVADETAGKEPAADDSVDAAGEDFADEAAAAPAPEGYAVEAFDEEGPREQPSGELPLSAPAAEPASPDAAAADPAADTAADLGATAERTAVVEPLASTTASMAPVVPRVDESAAPAAAPAPAQPAPASAASLNFDGLEDSVTLNPDNTGLTADAEADATMPTAPVAPAPKPAAPDDPEWGKTSFRPQAANPARRATLFDLPDPSASGNDPFGTDPRAPKTDAAKAQPQAGYVPPVTRGSSDSGALFSAPVAAKVDTISAEDKEFEQLQRADSCTSDGEGALGRLKGLFGKKGASGNTGAKHGGWKGGAAPRAGLRMVDAEDAPTADDLRDEILGLGDDALISHDIWFVALGASGCDHAGMRAFLAQHRKQIRGAFVINLDSVAAGDLTLLTHEGLLVTRRADRRMLRLMGTVTNDLHIPVEMSKYNWASTDATPAMLSSMRAMTIMGTDISGKRALSRTVDDVAENVVPEQAVAVAEAVCELIRRS